MTRTAIACTIVLLALGFGAWLFFRPAKQIPAETVEFTGSTMGGGWSIKLRNPPCGQSPEQIERAVTQLLNRLENQMSGWRADSTVSQFNRFEKTDWFPVPTELAEVVAEAQRVSDQSGGAFDITVAPLVGLWGFGPSRAATGPRTQPPGEGQIAAARRHVGYHLLESRLDPPALRKTDAQITIDLGGIGKGFAADKVGAYLDSLGVKNYLVAIGGELRARGDGGKGTGWVVGIETPTPDVRRVLQTLVLRDASLSTSGDYRNFVEIGGQRYCHEIDPRTGRPIPGGLASVSVVHPSGATADAMATALMVLGGEKGETLARDAGLTALFVTRGDGRFELTSTPAFTTVSRP